MAQIIKLNKNNCVRHLYWRSDNKYFVTLLDDGNVILDGKIMTLVEATKQLLKTAGAPATFFWE